MCTWICLLKRQGCNLIGSEHLGCFFFHAKACKTYMQRAAGWWDTGCSSPLFIISAVGLIRQGLRFPWASDVCVSWKHQIEQVSDSSPIKVTFVSSERGGFSLEACLGNPVHSRLQDFSCTIGCWALCPCGSCRFHPLAWRVHEHTHTHASTCSRMHAAHSQGTHAGAIAPVGWRLDCYSGPLRTNRFSKERPHLLLSDICWLLNSGFSVTCSGRSWKGWPLLPLRGDPGASCLVGILFSRPWLTLSSWAPGCCVGTLCFM